MDILAARKKAAEQANARNKPEPEAAAPAAPSRQEPEAPPAPAESGTGSPAAAGVAPVTRETGDQAGMVPVPSAGEPEENQQGEIEMLSFRLGGEEYAV